MNDIILDNDYFISYFMGDRTLGIQFSGLSLEAIISRSPTGSAISSSFMAGPSSSLVAATTSSSSITTVTFQTNVGDDGAGTALTQSYTQSIVFESSQSINTHYSSSIPGLSLQMALVEYPPCSAEYVGVFDGGDISTALSASYSTSYSSSFSSTVSTGSFSGSFASASSIQIVSESFITMSVSGFTESFSASTAVALDDQTPRSPGVYEIITSGSHLRMTTPLTLRSARFVP